MSGIHESNRQKSIEWYTPPAIFDAIGLQFDLDPCAPRPPAAPWLPVDRRYCAPDFPTPIPLGDNAWACDGLEQPWNGRVWLNPPYGRYAPPRWVGRLIEHAATPGGSGIALVFVRACTDWWQTAAAAADNVLFLRGRVDFKPGAGAAKNGKGHASAPACLLAYGAEEAEALERSDLGLTMSV